MYHSQNLVAWQAQYPAAFQHSLRNCNVSIKQGAPNPLSKELSSLAAPAQIQTAQKIVL